jgi:perosamine synthetase
MTLPRYRLYTKLGDYFRVAFETIFWRYNKGASVESYEKAVSEFMGSPYGLTMPQARVSIYMAIKYLIRPGQKVILSPYTIHEVINMVICAGGVPVFADLDHNSCNLDPQSVLEYLEKEDNVGAVMVTHLHGLAMEVEELAAYCKNKGVAFIEDASQAFGTKLRGKRVGTFGDVGVFSFGMYKNLNTFYGGMFLTPHKDLYEKVRMETNKWPYQELGGLLKKAINAFVTDVATYPPIFKAFVAWIFRFGYLYDIELLNKRVRVEDNPQKKTQIPETYLRRYAPLQARIGLRALHEVDYHSKVRIDFARVYWEGLKDVKQITHPPFYDDMSHIYTYYPILCENREAVVKHLMKNGCDLAIQHLKNCASLECFKEYANDCPNAERTANQVILLPTYSRYSLIDVHRIIHHLREYYQAEDQEFNETDERSYNPPPRQLRNM